ncbi:MAG: hypothetical protein D6814_12800 [Calditrichaeota bacterium]|nr:MAG: hypothetical protein D6814_12800 [Calditrichota bacterium]
MLFSSLRSLPPAKLGRVFYEWEYKPGLRARLVWWIALAGVLLVILYVYLFPGRENKAFQHYAEVLFYVALPIFSILFPRAILAWKTRYYLMQEYGFTIHFGELDKPQPGSGWAYWQDFDRVELFDRGVKIFPKKFFLRKVTVPCPKNRTTVYSFVSEKIAQFRYHNMRVA